MSCGSKDIIKNAPSYNDVTDLINQGIVKNTKTCFVAEVTYNYF